MSAESLSLRHGIRFTPEHGEGLIHSRTAAAVGGGLFAGILRSRLLLPGCMFVTLPALSPGRKPVLSHAVSFHPSAGPAGEGPGARR